MSIQMLSDEELLGRIRSACRQKRLHLNMTQSEMAGRAGLSLAMIKNFERGHGVNILSLIKIFRALGELQRIESMVPEIVPSPMAIFLGESKAKPTKRRARRAKG